MRYRHNILKISIIVFMLLFISIKFSAQTISTNKLGWATTDSTWATMENTGVLILGPIVSKTTTDGNWSEAATWGGTLPGPNDAVKIANNVIVNGHYTANSATIIASGYLTIPAGKSLTVTNYVSLEAISKVMLESTSTSFASLILGSLTGSGIVNYKRYTSMIGSGTTGGNDLVSAPLSGGTFGDLAAANTNLAASGIFRAFAPYNNGSGAYENYNTSSNAVTTLTTGLGYRAATIDGSTVTFTGTVYTEEVLVPITIGAANDWNLIGNPYPSYIKLAEFLEANKTKFNSSYAGVYGYDGNAEDGWTVWNSAYSIINPNAIIAPGQGFFVSAAITEPVDVNFTKTMRSIGSSDDFILGKSEETNAVISKIKLSQGASNYKTDIYFIEVATRGLDAGFDSGVYKAGATGLFTHLLEDNSGIEMAIQSLPYSDLNNVEVPLGIHFDAGKEISISLDDASTLPSNINVYLEDKIPNKYILLNDGAYLFTPSETLKGTGRYSLHYTSTTLSTVDFMSASLKIYLSDKSKTLFINGQLSGKTKLHLYDIQGRLVLNKEIKHGLTSNVTDISSITPGIYLVKVYGKNENKIKKILIE